MHSKNLTIKKVCLSDKSNAAICLSHKFGIKHFQCSQLNRQFDWLMSIMIQFWMSSLHLEQFLKMTIVTIHHTCIVAYHYLGEQALLLKVQD
ncbi:hypothetical protein B4U80_07737 [Leptotrombidium deliense]|uniref:Uncharacterized protein n=1 Tax=Leptotrombidium deliense TaxID=299467 RepID=A0A443SBK7_9ACAR|nr:hypothetical protein B4U80_07737 [Leptotrombidium deliense]